MNEDDARRLAQGLADFLPAEGAVLAATEAGQSDAVTDCCVEGLRLQGRDVVVRYGLGFEEAARLVAELSLAGGTYLAGGSMVMIGADGSKLPVDTVMAIVTSAEADNFVPAKEQGSILQEPSSVE